jgi:hypothetical protein
MRDLGLTYEEAAHGVQSCIRFEMSKNGFPNDGHNRIVDMLKHLRVGTDMRAAEAGALAALLISKGVFTELEYTEYMRVAANEELARYEAHCREKYGLPDAVQFR